VTLPLPPALRPDLEKAKRFLLLHPPPGRLLQVGITGAHEYGFPSPDSDVDLKGIHLAPTRALLGLSAPPETHDLILDFEGVEHDLTTHELGKALALLLGGNGNVLERLTSPFQLVDSREAKELRELANTCICKTFVRHYRGFFMGTRREHEKVRRAKSMLYSYRVALTGVHLLRTGEVEPDLRANAPRYGFEEILELVELKQSSKEKAPLDDATDARFRARWPDLEQALRDAYAESSLPEEPPNAADVEAWLVDVRAASL